MASDGRPGLGRDLAQLEAELAGLDQRLERLLQVGGGRPSDPLGTPRLEEKLARIRARFGSPDDLVIRRVDVPSCRAVCLFFAGLVRQAAVGEQILEPLSGARVGAPARRSAADYLERLACSTRVPSTKVVTAADHLEMHLHDGSAILLVDGVAPALALSVRGGERRAIEDPPTEPTIMGSRAGFVEDMETNLSLLRRQLRSRSMRFQTVHLGRPVSNRATVVWVAGITRPEVVAEVLERIEEIEPDLLTTGTVTELVGDHPWSIFPTVQATERVDLAGQGLLRGQVALVLENSPFVLMAPALLVDFLKSPDDLNFHFLVGSMLRLVRVIGFLLALFAPGMYVAVTSYHHELIPAELLFNIATGREGVPMPPVLEALSMELAVEILREAGSRMPRAIGPAVSIVGVLLLGDAAIQASLVSPLMLVVVGTTVLAQFLLPYPQLVAAVRNVRLGFIVIAGFMGLFGLLIALALLVTHLVALRSFGVPYLYPLSPTGPGDVAASLTRMPWWQRLYRPRVLSPTPRALRQPRGQAPRPEQGRSSHRQTRTAKPW